MKRSLTLVALLVVPVLDGAFPTSRAQGIIEGTVKLPAQAAVPLLAARYQIKNGSPIAPPDSPMAVIYLEGSFPAQRASGGAGVVQMGQKNFQFTPGILPI